MKEVLTIMIVEDEKLLSGEIREFLTRWGYRAVSCTRSFAAAYAL